jgi:hypothetical protein
VISVENFWFGIKWILRCQRAAKKNYNNPAVFCRKFFRVRTASKNFFARPHGIILRRRTFLRFIYLLKNKRAGIFSAL